MIDGEIGLAPRTRARLDPRSTLGLFRVPGFAVRPTTTTTTAPLHYSYGATFKSKRAKFNGRRLLVYRRLETLLSRVGARKNKVHSQDCIFRYIYEPYLRPNLEAG